MPSTFPCKQGDHECWRKLRKDGKEKNDKKQGHLGFLDDTEDDDCPLWDLFNEEKDDSNLNHHKQDGTNKPEKENKGKKDKKNKKDKKDKKNKDDEDSSSNLKPSDSKSPSGPNRPSSPDGQKPSHYQGNLKIISLSHNQDTQ